MSEFQPNTEPDSQEGRINPDYERRRQELDESRRKLEYDEGILDQREAFGVYDNHEGADIPEGELTWEQYLENRPKDGVIRDEKNGGFRDAESGQFASREDYESSLERGDSSSEAQAAVDYSDESSSELVKEALLARKRGDIADEKEILDIVSERMTHEISNNLEDYGIRIEESNKKAEAIERRLEKEMDAFRARIDKLETMAYAKAHESDSSHPIADIEPTSKPDELTPEVEEPEQEGSAPEKLAVVETFTSSSGAVVYEVVNDNGETSYTSKEDFDLRTNTAFATGNEIEEAVDEEVVEDGGADDDETEDYIAKMEAEELRSGIDSDGNAVLARSEGHMPERRVVQASEVIQSQEDGGEDSGEEEARGKFSNWWSKNKKYFKSSYWSAKAAIAMEDRQNRGEGGDSDNAENDRRKETRKIIMGAAVVGGVIVSAYLLSKYGSDTSGSINAGDVGVDTGINPDLPGGGEVDLGSSGGEADVDLSGAGEGEVPVASPELFVENPVYEIPSGSGGEALFQRMGLNPTDWYGIQEQLLASFPGDFYRMDSGNVGLSHSGWLSEEARTFLENYKNGNI